MYSRIAGGGIGTRSHGEQYDALNGDLVLGEESGQAGHAACAGIFAREEQRGVAAVVGVDESAYELGERGDISGGIPEAGALARMVGPAECGADGIHEYQVRVDERGIGIVGPGVRRLAGGSVTGPLHALRSEAAKLLPGGGHAGSAAHEEHQRARRFVADAVFGIAGIKQVGHRLAGGSVAQGLVADPHGVGQRFAIGRDLLVGFGGRRFGDRHACAGRGVISEEVACRAGLRCSGGGSASRGIRGCAGLLCRGGGSSGPAALGPRSNRQAQHGHEQELGVPKISHC